MRLRLVAVLVALTAIVLVAHDVPLAAHLSVVERDRIETGLQRDAFTLAGRAEERLEHDEPTGADTLRSLIDAYRRGTGARVLVTDRSGLAVVTSDEDSAGGTDYSSRPEVAQALRGSTATGRRVSRTLGQDLLFVAVPVRSGDEILGSVRLTFPAVVVDERVRGRVRGLAGVALVSLLTSIVVAILLAETVSRPLRRLRVATERLAGGDVDARSPVGEGPSDIRALSTSFNAMASRLGGLLRAQQAFAGDASHQLRTPLTALRIRLEQAGDLIDVDSAAARQRIDAAAAEAERLQHLVRQLLLLARAEGAALDLVTVDLAAVAADRVEVWEALAHEQGVDLRLVATGPMLVRAAPDAVEQVIDNYLDNALAVAPAGSAVEVAVRREADRGVVEVADRGPGLHGDELDRAFDRFWRSARAEADGSGLGLAIVAQLVDVSGGVAALRARPGGGLIASASFGVA